MPGTQSVSVNSCWVTASSPDSLLKTPSFVTFALVKQSQLQLWTHQALPASLALLKPFPVRCLCTPHPCYTASSLGYNPFLSSRPSSDISSPEKWPSNSPGGLFLCSHRPWTSATPAPLGASTVLDFFYSSMSPQAQKLILFSVCPTPDMFPPQNMSVEWINVMIPKCQCWALSKPLKEKTENCFWFWALRELCFLSPVHSQPHHLICGPLLSYLGQSPAVALRPPVQRTGPTWF